MHRTMGPAPDTSTPGDLEYTPDEPFRCRVGEPRPMTGADEPSRVQVPKGDLLEGLGKTLLIIEAFDEDHPRVTVSALAKRCGLSRTTARRYLMSLCHYGYADTDGKLFWLLPRVLRLGHGYLTTARLPRLVQPFIQRMSGLCGETVNVSVLDGHEVLYVARSHAPRVVSIGFHPGARAPAHAVGPGVVIPSTWDDDTADRWVASHEFVRFSSHTVTDPTRFREAIRTARHSGYWIVEQQLDVGLCGIAVPLVDRKGVCHGAVGMTVQASAYSTEAMHGRLLPLLRETAKDLRPLLS